MAKRKRNVPKQQVPRRYVTMFFVIALVVAFAKGGSGVGRVLADNPPQVRAA